MILVRFPSVILLDVQKKFPSIETGLQIIFQINLRFPHQGDKPSFFFASYCMIVTHRAHTPGQTNTLLQRMKAVEPSRSIKISKSTDWRSPQSKIQGNVSYIDESIFDIELIGGRFRTRIKAHSFKLGIVNAAFH